MVRYDSAPGSGHRESLRLYSCFSISFHLLIDEGYNLSEMASISGGQPVAAINFDLIRLKPQHISNGAGLSPFPYFTWVGFVLYGHCVTHLEAREVLGFGGELLVLQNMPLLECSLSLISFLAPLCPGLKLFRL